MITSLASKITLVQFLFFFSELHDKKSQHITVSNSKGQSNQWGDPAWFLNGIVMHSELASLFFNFYESNKARFSTLVHIVQTGSVLEELLFSVFT